MTGPLYELRLNHWGMKKSFMFLLLFLLFINCHPVEEDLIDLGFTVKNDVSDTKGQNDANRIRVKNIEALRKLPIPNKTLKEVTVLGYYEPNDGGEGSFYWDSKATEHDNGGTIIKVKEQEPGRWKRIYNDTVNVKWFGAKGDGRFDDSECLQKAFDLRKTTKIPKSDNFYLVTQSLKVNSEISSNEATLFSNVPGITLLEIVASNVKIKGLRIIGHDTIVGEEPYFPAVTTGIAIKNKNGLNIEKCEIAGWSYGGIYIFNSVNNIARGNYIHHNRRSGLGYGIVLHNESFTPTNVQISCNYFEYNRHDIAGSGNEGLSYEAAYNIVGPEGVEGQHRFDMHGKNGNLETVAGTKILIHNNNFLSENSIAIRISGIPEEGAWIYSNNFRHSSSERAFMQTILKQVKKKEEQIKMFAKNNAYNIASDVFSSSCE